MFPSTSGRDLELVSEILLNYCSKIEDLHFCFAQDLASFYPYYLCEHVKPRTKVFIDTLGKFQLKPTYLLPALPFHCNIQCNSNSRETDIWQVKYFYLRNIFFTSISWCLWKKKKILSTMIHSMNSTQDRVGLARCRPSSGVPQSTELSRLMDKTKIYFWKSILIQLIFKGYGLAWYSHFTIEMNKPATWQVKIQ